MYVCSVCLGRYVNAFDRGLPTLIYGRLLPRGHPYIYIHNAGIYTHIYKHTYDNNMRPTPDLALPRARRIRHSTPCSLRSLVHRLVDVAGTLHYAARRTSATTHLAERKKKSRRPNDWSARSPAAPAKRNAGTAAVGGTCHGGCSCGPPSQLNERASGHVSKVVGDVGKKRWTLETGCEERGRGRGFGARLGMGPALGWAGRRN